MADGRSTLMEIRGDGILTDNTKGTKGYVIVMTLDLNERKQGDVGCVGKFNGLVR